MNFVMNTTYGMVRFLFDATRNLNICVSKLNEIHEYLTDENNKIEKIKYKEFIKFEKFSYDSIPIQSLEEIEKNTRLKINIDTELEFWKWNDLKCTHHLDNIYVQPFISFLLFDKYKNIYALPFYCIGNINPLEDILTNIVSKFNDSITFDRLNILNDIFYQIKESDERRLIFFMADYTCNSPFKITGNFNGKLLSRIFILSTSSLVNFSILDVFIEQVEKFKTIIYSSEMPYELEKINILYPEMVKEKRFISFPTFKDITDMVKKHNIKSRILFGQTNNKFITPDSFKYWLQYGKVPRDAIWRLIFQPNKTNCVDTFILFNILHEKTLILIKFKSMDNFENLTNIDNLNENIPPILLLDDPEFGLELSRVSQSIFYIPIFETTVVSNFTIMPISNELNLNLFKSHKQRTCNISTIINIFTKLGIAIENNIKCIMTFKNIKLLKITLNTHVFLYLFSSENRYDIVDIDLKSFIKNFLSQIKNLEIKNTFIHKVFLDLHKLFLD